MASRDASSTRVVPVQIFRLGEEPGDDLSRSTTAEERLDMVAELSRRMWELSGRATPSYARCDIPVQVVRRGGGP